MIILHDDRSSNLPTFSSKNQWAVLLPTYREVYKAVIDQRTGARASRTSARVSYWLFTLCAVALSMLAPMRAQAQGNGIGGYDLKSTADQAIAFDYNSSGKADHLLLYRPGDGIVWILANQNGVFAPVFTSGNGIGGYDLRSPNDRIVALDFTASGHNDHLVCYRPGSGIVWILANNGGTFTPVFQSTSGIGGYDLLSPNDQMLPFDAFATGDVKDLLAYRPGSGIAWVLVNTQGNFQALVQTSTGIENLDLKSTSDRIIAFDLVSSTQLSTLIAYRPGQGIADVVNVQNTNSFTPVYSSTVNPATGLGNGFANYDLLSPEDQMIPFDYNSNGKLDHVAVYRPGSGILWVIHFALDPLFAPVYTTPFDPATGFGPGIGGYDLRSTSDRLIPFDYQGTGKLDHLVAYRPGSGIAFILANSNGNFSPVFASAPEP